MTKNAVIHEAPSTFKRLAVDDPERQRALEHEILRSIVESDGSVAPETREAVKELRELVKNRNAEEGEAKEAVAITFLTIVITAAVAAIVKGIEALLQPPQGAATIYNPGPPIKVLTYDEGDGVRWIAYREYTVGTLEAVPVTARGNNAVQIVVVGKPAVHTCAKGQSYAYDGSTMQPRSA